MVSIKVSKAVSVVEAVRAEQGKAGLGRPVDSLREANVAQLEIMAGLATRYQWLVFVGALVFSGCGSPRHSAPGTAAQSETARPEPDRIRVLPGFSSRRVADPVFGGDIYVLEAGPVDASPLVLVHGIGAQGSADWYPVLERLCEHYRVLALDLPGFGRSDESDILYSPDRYVEALRALTKTRIGRPFHLVGHSMGGAIALLFAGTYPDDVERLVLADVAGILHRHALAGHVAALTEHKATASEGGARGPVGLVTGALKQTLRVVDVSPGRLVSSDLARNKLLGNDPQTVAALTLVEFNFGPATAAVRAPTLLVWGRNDNVAPLRTAKALAVRIGSASLHILEGSAHVPMSTEPEAFVDVVHRHLSGASLPVPAMTTVVASGEPGVCRHQETAVFEGRYDTIDIVNCGRVTIRDSSAVSIHIEASTVEMENTVVEGRGVGLTAVRSNVAMTGGRITAPIAIHAVDGTLDLAGVEIVGENRAVSETSRVKLLLSICKVKSPFVDEHLHGLFSISPENPLEINAK